MSASWTERVLSEANRLRFEAIRENDPMKHLAADKAMALLGVTETTDSVRLRLERQFREHGIVIQEKGRLA